MSNTTNTSLIKLSPQELAVQEQGHLERKTIISSNLLVVADHALADAVSRFSTYTDPTGKPATSPMGVKTTVNKKIKAAYGCERDAMTGLMKLHCSVLHDALSEVINVGMARFETRRLIKDQMWLLIKMFGEQWSEIKRILYES